MNLAARCYMAAGAVVAAGTMITVISTPSSLPGVQVRPFQLMSDGTDILASADETLANLIGIIGPTFADPLLNLQAEEISSNAALVTQELTGNADLLTSESGLESSLVALLGGGADPGTLTGFVDHLVDANNLLVGTSQTLFDSLIGADNFSPATIDSSLGITSAGDVPFVTDGIGGVEGATGNTLAAYGDYISYLNTQFGLGLADFSSQDFMAAVTALANADAAFNTALVADETTFNTNLVTEELNAETAAFGNDSALNGVVDRMINIDNLYLATGETSFNSVVGATNYDPAELTQGLLTGADGSVVSDPTNVFDTGDLGGLQGIFDQNAALASDLAGLTPAEISSAFAPGVFDPTAFTAAIGDLYDVGVFSNLAPDFATMSTDFGTVVMSMF
jgi:hypothetical protein